MKPFHTIAVPYDDILKGRLTMDGFLSGRERFKEEVKIQIKQGNLFNE